MMVDQVIAMNPKDLGDVIAAAMTKAMYEVEYGGMERPLPNISGNYKAVSNFLDLTGEYETRKEIADVPARVYDNLHKLGESSIGDDTDKTPVGPIMQYSPYGPLGWRRVYTSIPIDLLETLLNIKYHKKEKTDKFLKELHKNRSERNNYFAKLLSELGNEKKTKKINKLHDNHTVCKEGDIYNILNCYLNSNKIPHDKYNTMFESNNNIKMLSSNYLVKNSHIHDLDSNELLSIPESTEFPESIYFNDEGQILDE